MPDAGADRAGLAAARQRSSTSIIISPGSALISVPLQPNLPMSPDGCRLDSWVASSRLSSAKPRPSIATKAWRASQGPGRSEEHTSELQSLMRISYAVFCLTKKKKHKQKIKSNKKKQQKKK